MTKTHEEIQKESVAARLAYWFGWWCKAWERGDRNSAIDYLGRMRALVGNDLADAMVSEYHQWRAAGIPADAIAPTAEWAMQRMHGSLPIAYQPRSDAAKTAASLNSKLKASIEVADGLSPKLNDIAESMKKMGDLAATSGNAITGMVVPLQGIKVPDRRVKRASRKSSQRPDSARSPKVLERPGRRSIVLGELKVNRREKA